MESVRINKSTSLSAAALDEATLEKINRFTLEPLTADQSLHSRQHSVIRASTATASASPKRRLQS